MASITSPTNEESKVEQKKETKLHMNGHLQVVETNKSLWNEELKSFEPDKYITDMLKSKKSRITAVMSYKKGEHLKLIPFFKPPVSKEPVSDKANGELKKTASQFD